jgi:Concanavalin A-like lectin/glucanases superfamily
VQEAQEEALGGVRQEEEVQEAEAKVGGVAMTRGLAGAMGVAASALTLLLAPGASAATLVGDYQLQGTRASSVPATLLVDVGATNSFQSDSVFGIGRQVLAFPVHSGVAMSPAGVGGPTQPWSIVTTFRLDAITGFRRILDPTPGDGDDIGVYDEDGKIDIFNDGPEALSQDVVFEPNHYATVAVTSAPPTLTKAYVNGRLATQATQADETLAILGDTFRFFKDQDGGTGTKNEDSAGAVSCIRVFQGVLTDAEVSAIGASATCQAPPAPPAKKKCKKHKRKHRAADAKKKKCKKKKK